MYRPTIPTTKHRRQVAHRPQQLPTLAQTGDPMLRGTHRQSPLSLSSTLTLALQILAGPQTALVGALTVERQVSPPVLTTP